jgi:RNA polymerase sigma-70 factor (ECF subfamily)
MVMTLSRPQSQIAQASHATPDFEALFLQHWNRLCGLLYHLVGDWSEAEDLALEAFVQLYRRPPAEDDNLGGWLYRVGTNLGLNALRARKRRQRYEEQAGMQILNDNPSGDPATVIERAQAYERVRDVLKDMKPRSAQMLILRHSGISYAEIAAALDIAPGSVGTLLARAEKEFERLYTRRG